MNVIIPVLLTAFIVASSQIVVVFSVYRIQVHIKTSLHMTAKMRAMHREMNISLTVQVGLFECFLP